MEFYGSLEDLLTYAPESGAALTDSPVVSGADRESTSLEELLHDKTHTFVEILRQIEHDTPILDDHGDVIVEGRVATLH